MSTNLIVPSTPIVVQQGENNVYVLGGSPNVVVEVVGDVLTQYGNYLKLDQTYPQTVINGAPEFAGGIVIKAGQKLIFDGG